MAAYEEERSIALTTDEDEDTTSSSYLRKLEIKGNRIGAERHKQRLGESIVGDRRETSPYELSFQDDVEWRLLCKTTLNQADLIKLKEAIHNNYFFEMFIEDLPMWGYVGDIENEDEILGEVEGQSHTYLFPHLHFRLGTNKNQIVSATVTTERDRRVDITDVNKPTPVQFSYSVEYFEDDLPWKMRMTRYADSRFLPGSFEIHWLSIINSFVLVLLLTAFLTIILMRVLKNDFSRYMEIDDSTMEEEEVSFCLIGMCVVGLCDYIGVTWTMISILFVSSCFNKIDSLAGSSFMVMSFASLNSPPSSVPPWGQVFNLRLQPCFSWDWP